MNPVEELSIDTRRQNIVNFFLIITLLIVSFLLGEWVLDNFFFSLSYAHRILISCILYGIIFVFTFYYAHRTAISSYEMGFHTLYLPKSLVIGFLATAGYLVVVLAFQMPLKYEPIISSAYPSVIDILILFSFTFLIGLTEEGAFRGYIQANYMKIFSQFKAIILTGTLFGILHIPSYIISGNYFNIASLPSLILIGLLLGYIRVHTGNIWGVVVAHCTWDFYMFLYVPQLDLGAPVSEITALLVASGAMWGTIVLAMVLAKKWLDRPEQLPAELKRAYSHKISKLATKSWELQQIVSQYKMSGLFQAPIIEKYTNRIQIYEESIAFLEEIIPQINEFNYKRIQSLVPLKLKAIKVQNLMKLRQYANRLSELEQQLKLLQKEIVLSK
ncbi:MAG: lysostaphin resistance A-like protein [Candidatus Helarchaeota archaeon]